MAGPARNSDNGLRLPFGKCSVVCVDATVEQHTREAVTETKEIRSEDETVLEVIR